MSAAAASNLRRLSAVVNNLRTVLGRSSFYTSQIRHFYLQPACAGTTKVEMPSLSPTMEAGTIIKWHKKEGDRVSPGDVLCDIQTDKAVVGMEYDDEGVMAKILLPDNTSDVKVGTLIALLVDEGDDWQGVQVPAATTSAAAATPPQPAAAAPQPLPASGSVPGITVEMPSLSPTMEKGTIIQWHKKEGDKINAGDVLCDIQTDKAVVGMEYDDEAVLAKILKPGGSADVNVGTLIALMVNEGEDWKDVQIPAAAAAPAPPAPRSPTAPPAAAPRPLPTPTATPSPPYVEEDLPGAGPSVKKLLSEYNIAASSVSSTGPKGNLLKGDVLSHIQSKGLRRGEPGTTAARETAAAPTPSPSPAASTAPYVDIPLSSMRKVIAKRLTESKATVPHAYASIDCSMRTVANTRKQYVAQGIKVSVNDFIIKAAGHALQRSPKVNAINEKGDPRTVATVDISVAVATEGGLITPIVPNVPGLDVAQVSQTVKALAEKARAGKLKPQEFQGGSFTISNLGMFGVREFTAVINPPQVAILAVGATRPTAGSQNSVQDPKMTVTLSYDARVLDALEATQFLEAFRLALENPDVMLGGALSPRNEDLMFGTAV